MALTKVRGLFTADTLTKKGYLNSLALLLDYGARMLVQFLLVPILKSGLGITVHGIWVGVNQWTVQYISAAGGRPTQSLEVLTANQQNVSDDEMKRRAVGSALAVWISFIPLLLLIGGFLIWRYPVFADVPPEYVRVTRWTIAILIIHIILFNLVDIPRAVLIGENMGYRRLGLSALGVLAMGAGMAMAVKLDWGLVGVGAMFSVTILVTGLLFLQVTRQFVTWFGVARPRRDETIKLLKLSGWLMLWQLVWQFISAGDVLLLDTLVEPDALALYSYSRFAPQSITGIVSAAIAGLMPGLGGLIGEKKFDRAADVRAEMYLLAWFSITVMGTVALICNRSFVTRWVGADGYIGFWPYLLLVTMLMIMLFVRQDSIIIDYTLDVKQRIIISFISVVVTLISSVALFQMFDTYTMKLCGLLTGFIIGRIILLITYPYLIAQALEISYLKQYVRSIRPFFVTLILFAVAIWLSEVALFDRYIGIMLVALGAAAVSTITAFLFGMTGQQRGALIGRVRNIV